MLKATDNSENIKSAYDVIIIGAGPAGLSTALNLLERGKSDILVVEKLKFPRYKCCAGYITAKTKTAYEKLGLDIEECHYRLIKDFNIFHKHKRRLTVKNKFLYTNRYIDRVELDNALFELAKKRGIETAENTAVEAHEPETSSVTLSDGRTLKYNHLVFADGTSGFGSRYQDGKKKNIAMQMTFESGLEESIDIHFGITKKGYGWVSTYDGVTNVGLTDLYRPDTDYGKIFDDFLHSLGFEKREGELKGAFTPIGTGKAVFGNVYFVGDAVGACDPLTLSGLRYGLKSGEVCAEAIASDKPEIYKKHVKKLKTRFGFMKAMAGMFYLKSTLWFVFSVLCRFFGGLVSFVFNNFFVNKK